MTEQEWVIKFKISDEAHYISVVAETPGDARAIFQQWLFHEEGESPDLPSKDWRELTVHGQQVTFKNEWVSSFQVLSKSFVIRG